jgi:hypothetical protein
MQSAAKTFEPAHQTRAERDQDSAVDFVLQSLDQADRGDHTAWALSNAMESIGARCRGTKAGPISAAQRDELLSAVARAHLGAIKHLPESYRREQIAIGMEALAAQVMLWAETRTIGAARAARTCRYPRLRPHVSERSA